MKPQFLTPLRLEWLDSESWLVCEPLVFDSAIVGRYTVPTGFVTDMASVPRLPLVYLTTGNTAHAAGTLHDHAYQTHACTRATADAVFYEAMTASGEPWWRRSLMYRAVRLFGGAAYRSGPARYRTLGNEALPAPLPGDLG